ncbi:hypothetical protein [Chromobacterium violaceum]|uniref:hypothetical protein n=1 Tax=Chromobacterium violaceum TaxID=536 RepID=UPI00143D7FC6|nr:hypothetical protein [Chromobacterium violaceum]QIY81509.1 hypothetical protein FOB43_21080 [Chromobacterium violaceum]
MRYPLRYQVQEWLAERVRWVQYPRQQFIPKRPAPNPGKLSIDDFLKLAVFGYVAWILLAPVLAVLGFAFVVFVLK